PCPAPNRRAEPWPGGVPGGNKADRGPGGAARRGTCRLRRYPRCSAVSAWAPFPRDTPPVAAELVPRSPPRMNDALAEVGATGATMSPGSVRALQAVAAPGGGAGGLGDARDEGCAALHRRAHGRRGEGGAAARRGAPARGV